MGLMKRPGGRDRALAQAAPGSVREAETNLKGVARNPLERPGGGVAQDGAAACFVAARAIRLIDLERRARFAGVASISGERQA